MGTKKQGVVAPYDKEVVRKLHLWVQQRQEKERGTFLYLSPSLL